MEKPWYKDGLRFKCTGCGACCTGGPGNVWVDEEDIAKMSKLLNMSRDDFVKDFTHEVGGRLSLIEHPINFDCIFLKNRKCLIYEARPKQCRAFPWWPENLHSLKDWNREAQRCEGINHPDAPLITLEEIKSAMQKED